MTLATLLAFSLGTLTGYLARAALVALRERRRVRVLTALVADSLAAFEAARLAGCQCDECRARRRDREGQVS
jgi:hypothetical protein